MLIEICAASIHSAINAEAAGADRIELCSELSVGGITPSYGLIREVLERVSIPVYVLIRPRSGDFVYSDEEFEVMKSDIAFCNLLNCAGVVSGVLTEDHAIDIPRTRKLMLAAESMAFTFHRAFDRISEPENALSQLIGLGVHRVLTSGQQKTAEEGLELLKKLRDQADGRIKILPGGGVNPKNILEFAEAGFTEVHASASTPYKETPHPAIPMNSDKFYNETVQYISSKETIRELVTLAGGYQRRSSV